MLIYLNTVKYFRENESEDFLRGDFAEGSLWTPLLNFRIPSLMDSKLKIKNARITGDSDITHIYSMYMFDNDHWFENKKVSDQILKLGSHALIINPKEFVDRVILSCLEPINYGFVKYYKPQLIPQRIDEFSKREEYKYQNEFRFVVKSKSLLPLQIMIGSLKNIATPVSTEALLKMDFKVLNNK